MELLFAALTFIMFVIKDLYFYLKSLRYKKYDDNFDAGYQACIDDFVSKWNDTAFWKRDDYVLDFITTKSNGRYKKTKH